MRCFAQRLRALNISVDNYCQFLPQDKVSKFVELKGTELLQKTVRHDDIHLIEAEIVFSKLRNAERCVLAAVYS